MRFVSVGKQVDSRRSCRCRWCRTRRVGNTPPVSAAAGWESDGSGWTLSPAASECDNEPFPSTAAGWWLTRSRRYWRTWALNGNRKGTVKNRAMMKHLHRYTLSHFTSASDQHSFSCFLLDDAFYTKYFSVYTNLRCFRMTPEDWLDDRLDPHFCLLFYTRYRGELWLNSLQVGSTMNHTTKAAKIATKKERLKLKW